MTFIEKALCTVVADPCHDKGKKRDGGRAKREKEKGGEGKRDGGKKSGIGKNIKGAEKKQGYRCIEGPLQPPIYMSKS